MTMTRKDYNAIADAILEVLEDAPDLAPAGEVRTYRAAIEATAERIANTLEITGGFDLNGNRRFKHDRFMKAAGFPPAPFEALALIKDGLGLVKDTP